MFKFISVKAFAASLALIAASIFAPVSFAQKQVILKGGTPVVFATLNDLSSKDVQTGNLVDLQVVSNVVVDGEVVIPAGTIAKGQVSKAIKSSALGKGGELTIIINSINAVDGSLIPLSGATLSAAGKDRVALSIICGICTLFGFLIHGSQAEIPIGSQVQASVMNNTSITI